MKKVVLLLSSALLALSQDAPECTSDICKLTDGCRCSDVRNPIMSTDNPAPQLVAITISGEISREAYLTYWKPLFFDRDDADQIGLTFFVSHQYTDYTLVNDLYKRGHEIGSYSITKNEDPNYWATANASTLNQEFGGQKYILSKFANINLDDIQGGRTPFFQLNGDTSIQGYADFRYDSSWPAKSTDHFLPYTLNCRSLQSCDTVPQCPTQEHDGFWVLPITNIKDFDNQECNLFSSCNLDSQFSLTIGNWLYNQVNAVRQDNRAPITIVLDSKWLYNVDYAFSGFSKFLDLVFYEDDIFLVTLQDVLDWIQDPKGYQDYTRPNHALPDVTCLNLLCPLQDTNGETRFMESCVSCPNKYPWLGNPWGN